MSARPSTSRSGGLSRVPYLPGLDGLRAIAVGAVMLYHANHTWMEGGYLGVDVFFVISGYLITMLLLSEHERTDHVDFRQFYLRRARRLLPALYALMAGVAVYIAAFYPETLYDVRGDFVAALLYVSNYYQIWVGQGYAAGEAFVPLRHLWSLAVEEQFYLVWPLVMAGVMRRNRGRLPRAGLKFLGVSLFITLMVAIIYVPGPVATSCSAEFSKGCWNIGGHYININEMLYLGSISRSAELLLGAAFAMLWRPMAIMRGPLRNKGHQLDIVALIGLLLMFWFMWTMQLIDGAEYNPWLYRGGLFLTGLATLMVIAAVTHERAFAGGLLGNPVLLWMGTRSYGLYLYHWPIYQVIRKQAQIELTFFQFVIAMVITVCVAEASYRFLETPIRTGHGRDLLRSIRRTPWRMAAAGMVALIVALSVIAMVTAQDHCVGEVACSLEENSSAHTTLPTAPATTNGTAPTVAPTTTLPPDPEPYMAIGESVMVGAADQLEEGGVYVDAAENRGPNGTRETIAALRDAGLLAEGTAVTIQVGTNGPLEQADLDGIMEELPDGIGPVFFMTLHAPPQWIPPNNELIRNMSTLYTNVQVIDWDAEAANIELCADEIHITCNGTAAATFYANLILNAFGLPPLEMPS